MLMSKNFRRIVYFLGALIAGGIVARFASYIPLAILGFALNSFRGDSGPAFGSMGMTEVLLWIWGIVFLSLWFYFTKWAYLKMTKYLLD